MKVDASATPNSQVMLNLDVTKKVQLNLPYLVTIYMFYINHLVL